MATATVYAFDIQLSDVDRGVYETLSLRVARQPSETAEYLLTRVLAYCLEHAGTMNHHYTAAEFAARYRENFGDAVELKDLMGGQGNKEAGRQVDK